MPTDSEDSPELDKQIPVTKKRGNPGWRKGKSGNPKGRPAGMQSVWEALSELMTPQRARRLAMAIYENACAGNTQLALAIIDRQSGKVPDRVHTSSINLEGKLSDEHVDRLVDGFKAALRGPAETQATAGITLPAIDARDRRP